ncbi:MAG TPA: UDP-N-acetylmuramoyl-L-alanyl-D-glutamate--2,6-diaminopimelate ligase [Burkholderiales bacterium]|nr:UDP-N-acetylmuramoyl-L-alanyl-D-glutamate--2,6-diaminopimelate ligase [Burkholderiales bacterium]
MSPPGATPASLRPPALTRDETAQHALATQSAVDALSIKYTGVAIDSRKVKAGDLFLAYPGDAADGRDFIPQALAAGAIIVVWEESGFDWNPDWNVPNIPVADLRRHAGYIADRFFKHPSRHLWVTGVTGTNGKTTCSQWIAQSFNRLQRECAVIGTLGQGLIGDNDLEQAALNTTPDPVTLHAFLGKMRVKGARAVAMEVSSHGLEQGRVNGIDFDVAMFTNLSRDHLDYHGDMQAYGDAKARLFAWPSLKHAVVNLDDRFGAELASRIDRKRVNVIGYGLGKGEITGHKLDLSTRGLKLEINTPWGAAKLRSNVLGTYNAHNILGVLGVLVCSDVTLKDAVDVIAELEPVPGRMQTIRETGFPLVVVDYCHTPDALEKTLESLRDLLKRGGRLHCVFGAGGDRDAGKRPLMGEVATRLADQSIVTSDNPRSEDPRSIIDDIIAGAHDGYRSQPDRGTAIREAISNAAPDDVVLIAGKGHETYQEVHGKRLPFSDIDVARAAMTKRISRNLPSKGGARV